MSVLLKNISMLDVIKGEIVKDIDILIEEDKITKIEKGIEFPADNIINGEDKLAIPGLVNSHSHLGMATLRNFADDLNLNDWLMTAIFPIEAKMVPDDVYWASQLSIIEMIQSGVTTFCDNYYFMDKVADATIESGMRALLTRGLADIDGKGDEKLKETEDLYQKYNNSGEGRIRIAPAPHAIYTCSTEFLVKIMEMAERLNTIINLHVSETIKEVNDCIAKTGMTPVNYLDDIGMLRFHLLAAHCTHITEEEINLVRNRSFYPVYNPTSNLKLASGFTPIDLMLKKKMNIALGTDGSSSNNNQNMVEEIHIASLVNKAVTLNAEAVPAIEVLKMATINGARALGIEKETGSIEVGKKGDIAIFNLNSPSFTPRNNLISALCYSAQSNDVETVIVDGKIIMKNKEILTLDVEKVLNKVNAISEDLKRR